MVGVGLESGGSWRWGRSLSEGAARPFHGRVSGTRRSHSEAGGRSSLSLEANTEV